MKLYVVRNKEGKFFRSIGYGGSGSNWVDTLEKAKFYSKIGQAKSRCTYFTNHYPQFGTPDILEFSILVEEANILDMTEITEKAVNRIKKNKEERDIRSRQWQIENLQREQEEIKKKLNSLK
jgi:hypothetical protein